MPIAKKENIIEGILTIELGFDKFLTSSLNVRCFGPFSGSFSSLFFTEYDRNFRLIIEKHMIVVKLAQYGCS